MKCSGNYRKDKSQNNENKDDIRNTRCSGISMSFGGTCQPNHAYVPYVPMWFKNGPNHAV